MNRLKCILFLALMILGLTACEEKAFSDDPDAIEKASRSVVELNIYAKDNTLIATGSGFFALDPTIIITNYHVIEGAYRVEAIDDNNLAFDVPYIINYSEDSDLVILQINPEDAKYEPLRIATSEQMQRGENIVAIGSPLGIKNTISKGTISNIVVEDGIDMIQFTAAISSGSSGGVLLNDAGEVIGVTSASYVNGQNLNLAIPISEVNLLYEKPQAQVQISEHYENTVIIPIPIESLSRQMTVYHETSSGIFHSNIKCPALDDDYVMEFVTNRISRTFAPCHTCIEMVPQAAVFNGQLFDTPGVSAPAPLSVEVSADSNYYIILEPIPDEADKARAEAKLSKMGKVSPGLIYIENWNAVADRRVSCYISAGETIELSVPVGGYEIYYASGDTWYGTKYLFGETTTFHRCEGVFDFYYDGRYYQGWTLELYRQANGNMNTEVVDADQFPIEFS